jgi:2-oxoisovalerate dehydrogenase E1 component alpha subunit
VIDSDGSVVDPDREPPAIEDEQALQWYKNMLTGTQTKAFDQLKARNRALTRFPTLAVNIMDKIMSEAQRQGRLSFYMVSMNRI